MHNKVIGIAGLVGAGKTSVALALCERHGALYCGVGSVYLSFVELLHRSGWDLQAPLMEAQSEWVTKTLARVRLDFCQSNEAGLHHFAVYAGETLLPTLKDTQRSRRAAELANMPIVNQRILGLIQHNVERTSTHMPIALDGRQAHLITRNSVFLTADTATRVQRVQVKFQISMAEAAAFIHHTDKLDGHMNDDAKRVLTDQIIDTTELTLFRTMEEVEHCLGLTPSRCI
jgi:cytidylate kinase